MIYIINPSKFCHGSLVEILFCNRGNYTSGYDYICVSRSKLKKYKADTNQSPIVVLDKKEQPITLQKVTVGGSSDNYLQVHSEAKSAKETSMNTRFADRFEDGLKQIKESLNKKSGVKKMQKYGSAKAG